jgi:Flp pilus assembly pilin Flp
METLKIFVAGEEGQDLVEYSLLLAAICLAGAAAFVGMGQNTTALWNAVNNRLASSNEGGS